MIDFENVHIAVQNREILAGINFSISPGERVVITGSSGAGKTTLLNSLVGVYGVSQGSIRLKGRELTPESAPWIRGEVAYIGQEPFLGADTGREALLLPFQFHRNKTSHPSEENIEDILSSLHLSKAILGQPSKELSGGEKQRLAIGRALLLKKEIFLLDEITSALDPKSIQAVLELFSQEHYTLLSVSHDERWIQFCSRKIELVQGRITEDLPMKEE